MTEVPATCPQCHQETNSYKISVLFIQALAYLNHQEDASSKELGQFLHDVLPETQERPVIESYLSHMVKVISPPHGERKVTRRIHPDGMIAFLLSIALTIIFLASKDQPGAVPGLIILTIFCAVIYLITRQMLLKRYNQSKLQEQREVDRISVAVSNWMKMYLCSRDNIVFEPDHGHWSPVENMQNFLNEI
jgi:hypothetical protein